MKTHILRFAAALAMLVTAGAGGVGAQNYDGGGLLKFGVFGQGTFLNFDLDQPGSASATANGLTGGLSFGFDVVNRSGFLYGIEADASFGDARGSALNTNFGFDYMGTLRARFGGYVHRDVLMYGTAGVAWLGFEAAPVGVAGGKAYETLTGFTVGAGIEWDWHHTLLFTEYLYAGFGSRTFNVDTVRHEADADAHLLRFGIKFKTGHDHYHGDSRGTYGGTK